MKRKIRMLSLFSGIGSPETAIKNLGYDLGVVNFCEIDKYATTSYCALHEEDIEKNLNDVTLVDGKQFQDIDLVFHGSPCQSYSVVNTTTQTGGDKDSGTKSSLMWETVRIVAECKPKIVIWENVKNVLSAKHKHNFDQYIEELNKLGYTSTYKIISPRDLGESQSRPRIFVVSVLEGEFEFPENTPKPIRPMFEYLESDVHEHYTMSETLIRNFAFNNPAYYGRIRVVDPKVGMGCLSTKGAKASRTNNYIFKDILQYMDYTERYNNMEYILENNIPIRALTPLEYWRLQGFTDEQFYIAQKALANTYKKGNLMAADAQLYKQAGNSIHVKVLESFIGKVLEEHLND